MTDLNPQPAKPQSRHSLKSNPAEEREWTEDETSIFNETGRFQNRDEMALDGNSIVQGGSNADTDDTWEFERKDELKGDTDYSSEAVDTQLSHVAQITEEIHDPASHHQGSMAVPLDGRHEFDAMSDHDLMNMADVLGIPDRDHLLRPQLIERIRHYQMHPS